MSDERAQHKIPITQARKVVDSLGEMPDRELSVKDFVVTFWDEMQKTGQTTRSLYDFFVSKGISLGNFSYFSKIYSRVGAEKNLEREFRNSKKEEGEDDTETTE